MAILGELRNTSVVKKTEPDARTRDQVARAILETGPATAADLASRLEMTPAGIRRHLDALVEDGVLTSREPYQSTAVRGRGRPARVFLMTDQGRENFEHSYDDLAVSALKFIASGASNLSIQSFADQRAQEMEARARTKMGKTMTSQSLAEKSLALAEFLTEEGFASDVTAGPIGDQICQHHCPVAHVATQFPELCEAETQAISRILGTHVQRLATIAHGDGVCTTFIPKLSSEKTTTGANT